MIDSKVCIIMPAFNEQNSIKSVIASISKTVPEAHLVVINDGSSDKTEEMVLSTQAKVINHPFNLGIGGAVQTGLIYAKEHGFKTAVQVDADGQHGPKYLPFLLKSLTRQHDMVIASRYLKETKYKTPPIRLLGIKIFSQLIYLTCGKRIFDSTSGYRVFNKRAIEFFSDYYPQEFPEPSSIVAFLKNGYKIKEVSVEAMKRQAGKSSVHALYAVYLMLSISIAILVESVKGKRSYYYE